MLMRHLPLYRCLSLRRRHDNQRRSASRQYIGPDATIERRKPAAVVDRQRQQVEVGQARGRRVSKGRENHRVAERKIVGPELMTGRTDKGLKEQTGSIRRARPAGISWMPQNTHQPVLGKRTRGPAR